MRISRCSTAAQGQAVGKWEWVVGVGAVHWGQVGELLLLLLKWRTRKVLPRRSLVALPRSGRCPGGPGPCCCCAFRRVLKCRPRASPFWDMEKWNCECHARLPRQQKRQLTIPVC